MAKKNQTENTPSAGNDLQNALAGAVRDALNGSVTNGTNDLTAQNAPDLSDPFVWLGEPQYEIGDGAAFEPKRDGTVSKRVGHVAFATPIGRLSATVYADINQRRGTQITRFVWPKNSFALPGEDTDPAIAMNYRAVAQRHLDGWKAFYRQFVKNGGRLDQPTAAARPAQIGSSDASDLKF